MPSLLLLEPSHCLFAILTNLWLELLQYHQQVLCTGNNCVAFLGGRVTKHNSFQRFLPKSIRKLGQNIFPRHSSIYFHFLRLPRLMVQEENCSGSRTGGYIYVTPFFVSVEMREQGKFIIIKHVSISSFVILSTAAMTDANIYAPKRTHQAFQQFFLAKEYNLV